MLRHVLLAINLALLGACQLAPDHKRPPWPAGAQYPDAFEPGQGTVVAREISWEGFFRDPRLRLFITTALEHNRDLQVSVLRIEEARGLFRINNATRYPTLGLDGRAVRSLSAFPVGASGSGGGTNAPAGSGISERFSVEVGMTSFELDFWGRVRNLTEGARAQYLATIEAQQAFRLSLIADVATTYMAIRSEEQRLRLAESTVENRHDQLGISEIRLDAGITSALEYNQAKALLAQAETQLAELRLIRARQGNFLALLTGAQPPGPLPEALLLTDQLPDEALVAGLPSELLYSRPDIIAAEERLRAARANIGVARAAFFPRITLTGSAGHASTELDGLISSGNEFWSIGPSISLPIFDFGGRRAELTVAKARNNIAVAEYERTVQAAFREVADALAGRRFLTERLVLQQSNVDTLGKIAELAGDRYAEGVVNFLQVLDAERSLFDAQQAFLQVQRERVENLVGLYIALGGGVHAERAARTSVE
jgi:multidrug efflux system outer membrane protein